MKEMFINQIKPINTITDLGESKRIQPENNIFSDIFANAIENVRETDAELTKQQYLLAVGEIDDPHTVTIAATKAQISVDMMIALRNKAMESYNEIMRINL